MFVAVVGTRASGKSAVAQYLVEQKGFHLVKLMNSRASDQSPRLSEEPQEPDAFVDDPYYDDNRLSFLQMTSQPPSALPSPAPDSKFNDGSGLRPLVFTSPASMLKHATINWQADFVTVDLRTKDQLEDFKIRPFFLVVSIDAPLLIRYKRCEDSGISLEEFIREHDYHYYGTSDASLETPRKTTFGSTPAGPTLSSLNDLVNLHVVNSFDSFEALHAYLGQLNLLDPERLRPGWDTYFMQLATLASRRSNCMKRRVGAILVRNNRILSTGYNGTPRGVLNCNEGGCRRCNSASETTDECVCLHAEENALLEAGRERVGDGAVLYCNTCPCLKCTIKIIQTGVREVVYNLGYKMDDSSAALFHEAGVILRRHATLT
ncbi:cytidine deaminase-like protein [Fomitopsis betulina]|nr:cytidine deaminase-like protein [Fomitopsis betulina]